MFRLALVVAVAATAPVSAAPPVTAVAYRADGKLLAAGGRANVTLIDPASGEVRDEISGLPGKVTSLAFTPAGNLIVAVSQPGRRSKLAEYRVADKASPELVREADGHKDDITCVAVSADGKHLAAVGYDRLVTLWDLPLGSKPRLTLTDHSDTVYSVAFHPEGKLLATAAADRAVKVWDVATGKRLYTLGDPTDWVYSVAWHATGNRLVAAGADKSVREWAANADGGKLTRTAFAHDRPVTHALLAGGRMVTVGEDKVVKVWDATKFTEAKVLPAESESVLAAAVRPDGAQLALGRFDGVLKLLDPMTGKVSATPLPAKPLPPQVTSAMTELRVGTTAKVTLAGKRLDTVTAVAGLGAKIVTKSPAALTLELTASAPGPHTVMLTSPAGDVATIVQVNRFPLVREQGGTDSARSAMTVPLPASIAGTVDRAGDTDYFRFQATAGQPVGVQLQSLAAASLFDPVIVLTDAAGTVLAEGTTTLGYVCPAAGEYAVAVRDREYRGGPQYLYRLHVGPVPVVTGVFPLAVSRGVDTTAHIEGVHLGSPESLRQTVRPPADAKPGSVIALTLPPGAVGPANVAVAEFPSAVVSDAASLRAVPASADGILAKPNDAHTIKFTAKKGVPLVVEVHAARLGSPVDPVIEIQDTAGKPVPRAVLRSTTKTYTTLRDHNSVSPGIRLETWNELAIDDHLFANGELMRILSLPKGPDDDTQFVQVEGKRVGYLGTTPAYHALGETVYRVETHPPGATFPPNGLPLFPIAYRNDDGGPGFGKDSMLMFDPPADGVFQVRVADAAGAGGPTHAYRLTVRPPRPDFAVKVTPNAPRVWKNGAVPVTITATRTDGYDGPIAITFPDLKPPFSAPPTFIEAGQTTTVVPLFAGPEALPKDVPPLRVVGTATIAGKPIERSATAGKPTVAEPMELVTTVASQTVTIRPGHETRMTVSIERRNGLTGRVPLEVRGLPHGVRVMNIGLNGILVVPGETQREVVLYAEPWVKPMSHPIVVLAKSERKGTEHAAKAVTLTVAE